MALTHFAQNRFALDLNAEDLRLRRETIPVVALRETQHTRQIIEAHATFEGWFVLQVPAGSGDLTVALALGANYRSLQINSVSRVPLARLHSDVGKQAEDASDQVQLDGITLLDGGVALCERDDALLTIHPTPQARPTICRVVFRPLARR